MRLVIHDYAGHPFQVQLSRELARRGHRVHHLYSTSTHTPRGALQHRKADPETLHIAGLSLGTTIRKQSFARRWWLELRYGRILQHAVDEIAPDAVISANTPLDSQRPLVAYCRRRNIRFVYWLQDAYGTAAARLLRRKLPVLGGLVGAWYLRDERRQLARSDHVVLISDDFLSLADAAGVDRRRVSTIPNWAPLRELPERPRSNSWAAEHGLEDTFTFLYSGTLGMKHDPELLVRLAREFAGETRVRVCVVSEGPAADRVRRRAAETGLRNVVSLPFQPYDRLSEVLASGDVLLAVLEADAGTFSVPSKVLSYLCAGRPLLLAVPAENLAARTVLNAGAGIVVPPGDGDALAREARRLYERPELREALGRAARGYAEGTFDVEGIADRFEQLLSIR